MVMVTFTIPRQFLFRLMQQSVDVVQLMLDDRVLDFEYRFTNLVVPIYDEIEIGNILKKHVVLLVHRLNAVRDLFNVSDFEILRFTKNCNELK